MKTIIAGTRNLPMEGILSLVLRNFDKWKITEVVSGHSGNVDLAGEEWALINGIPVTLFTAAWGTYGASAGPRRNRAMAEYADCLIVFWDGKSRGTSSMIEEAQKRNLAIQCYDM